MSNGKTLPEDIVISILSQLPIKSLCRFKCVSRSWKSLISDPDFAKTRFNRAKTVNPKYLDQKVILLSSSRNLYFVDIADENPTATKLDFSTLEQNSVNNLVKVWSSCNGLLLVSSLDYSNFLLNPFTRECKKLPKLPLFLDQNYSTCLMVYFYGICYDPSTDDYKVVVLCYDRPSTSAAVYSLKTDAWRTLSRFPFELLSTGCGVLFNGCLHCIGRRTGSYTIVAFDLLDEIFREVPLPAWLVNGMKNLSCYYLAVLENCLCLVCILRSNPVEVLMMKEYGVRESWTRFTIEMPDKSMWEFLCSLASNEMLVKITGLKARTKRDRLVVYNPNVETTLRDMVVRGIPTEFRFGGTYVESIVSPYQGGGTGRQ